MFAAFPEAVGAWPAAAAVEQSALAVNAAADHAAAASSTAAAPARSCSEACSGSPDAHSSPVQPRESLNCCPIHQHSCCNEIVEWARQTGMRDMVASHQEEALTTKH